LTAGQPPDIVSFEDEPERFVRQGKQAKNEARSRRSDRHGVLGGLGRACGRDGGELPANHDPANMCAAAPDTAAPICYSSCGRSPPFFIKRPGGKFAALSRRSVSTPAVAASNVD
jgi:hypothetical protein